MFNANGEHIQRGHLTSDMDVYNDSHNDVCNEIIPDTEKETKKSYALYRDIYFVSFSLLISLLLFFIANKVLIMSNNIHEINDFYKSLKTGEWVNTTSDEAGYLGITVKSAEITGGIRGVVVVDVAAGSPAALADVRINDFICAIDNNAIAGNDQFINYLNGKRPGDTVDLHIMRDGNYDEMVIKVGLGEK